MYVRSRLAAHGLTSSPLMQHRAFCECLNSPRCTRADEQPTYAASGFSVYVRSRLAPELSRSGASGFFASGAVMNSSSRLRARFAAPSAAFVCFPHAASLGREEAPITDSNTAIVFKIGTAVVPVFFRPLGTLRILNITRNYISGKPSSPYGYIICHYV